MKTGVTIVASTPAWNEPEGLLAWSAQSLRGAVDHHHLYAGGIRPLVTGGPWVSQAAMRESGRGEAIRWARRKRRPLRGLWLLQLDADEALVNGELLRAILERWPHAAYPLPLVQESGDMTLAPFKLFRAWRARIVACSEYVRWEGGPLYNLAGYTAPIGPLRKALLELPFLFHAPGLRGAGVRAGARLSLEELAVETRPQDAVEWPLPPLTLNGRSMMAKEDEGGSVVEYEAGDGDYACPGCGARYETPGICEGSGEGKHEPLAVEKVKGGKSLSSASAGHDEGPSVAELRKEAKAIGLTGFDKLRKAQLAAAIEKHKAATPA